MSKKVVNETKLRAAIEALTSLLSDIDDVVDREEMKARVDVFTTLLLETGLIARRPDDYLLNIDYAVRSLGGEAKKVAYKAREFYAALSSYEDDAGERLEEAGQLLHDFGPVVLEALKGALKKWPTQHA